MTKTANINTMRNTLIVLATVLALVAAALVPARAEAATAKFPTGSIEDAKPASDSMPKGSIKAVKASSLPKTRVAEGTISQATKGTISTKSTTTGYSGRPGYVALYPIQANANYGGNQYLTSVGAYVRRSPAYSGDQVITVRTIISKSDVQYGTYGPWRTWLNQSFSGRLRPGQISYTPRHWYYTSDIGSNAYVAGVQVTWRTPRGQLLASQNILLNHSRDFQCVNASGCNTLGTEGRVHLYLSYSSLG